VNFREIEAIFTAAGFAVSAAIIEAKPQPGAGKSPARAFEVQKVNAKEDERCQ